MKNNTMRKISIYILAFAFAFSSCEKEDEITNNSLNVSGIKSANKNEIVNIKLKSGETKSTEIGSYVFGSTVFDPRTSGYGYVDLSSNFKLINPETGELINEFTVPGFLSQTVIDSEENALIGQYSENGSNYVVKIDLTSGEIQSKNTVDFGDGILACTYFYSINKEYVLLRADGSMIFINTDNGSITKSIKVESMIDNTVYDATNNRLIGDTYSSTTDQNYVETINLETGKLISKAEIQERNNYYGCVSDYDSETNCYILVNYPQNKVLFIDIETGKIKDSHPLDFEINGFEFWRGK